MKNISIVRLRCYKHFVSLFAISLITWNSSAVGILSSSNLSLQQTTISGTLTDNLGIPIPDATIRIKDTATGVVSDEQGTFRIQAVPGQVLIISALGFITQSISIGQQTNLNITLLEEVTQLEGVTLNAGYYTVKEKERTGNIAKLTAKTIEKQPVNNPLAAMQGYISGVNIVQNTGLPGGGFSIQVRGQNFLNGSTEPLYIIDGVPFGSESLASTQISAGINGGNISPLNAMNPNDIESIEVLKDADATAIYGSRAANGVVLITTKKGRSGKTKYNVTMSSTLGQVSHFLDLMDTQQYLEVRREGIQNDGFGSLLENPAFDFVWPDVKTWDQNRYTDWQKELIGGTAYRNNLQLSASGGNEQTQFLLSGAYQKESTVFPGNSEYDKITVHNNLNHRSKDKRFALNLSTIYSSDKNNLPRTDLTRLAYTLEPNAPELYDENGDLNWEDNTFDNPLASLAEDYEVGINTLIANAGISYSITSDLDFKTSLGYTTYTLNSLRVLPSTARNPSFGFTPENYSTITTNTSSRQSWIVEPQLNYKRQWNKFQLNVLIGTTFQNQSSEQLVLRGTGFPNNELLRNLAAANTIEVRQDSDTDYRYHAVFGRINLNWMGKYIMNITGRRDGSSRFGPGKRLGNFGAVGLAWLFSEESGLKNNSFLSFGKLRGSYGTTGSDNIGDYKFLNTYDVSGFDYNGTTTIEPSGIFNPLFGWEENKKLEVALELGFLKDRLMLNTSWYQNRSSNQLIGIPLAATTGFNSLIGNFDATVENTGFEVDLQSTNLSTNNFKWRTNINFTVPKNRLVAFPNIESSTFANRYIIGEPLSIVRLYRSLGVDTETGLYEFQDYNGDGTITRLDDSEWYEDLSPSYFGGVGNTITYKNVSLDLFFQFKKQKSFNYLRTRSAPGFRSNASVKLLDRWQEIGDTAPVMLATASFNPQYFESLNNQSISSATISDASFVRLRNVTLNYNIPKRRTKGLDLNLYLQGQNLLTFTKFDGPDPEQASQIILPPLRQITLGLQISF